MRFEGNALIKNSKGKTAGSLNITHSLRDLGLGVSYGWGIEQSYFERIYPVTLSIGFDETSCDVLWSSPDEMLGVTQEAIGL